ncbi:P-loop containing nucleoside triphosphate hydrolase protein, partial [Atractiella rhizophila]
ISFNERMLWCVRLWSIVEINLNSVERIQEYMELEACSSYLINKEKLDGDQPPASWPSRAGEIVVEDFSCRYAKELSPVLKGVSFTVKPGEKIGIVGRTGSGKSTLALSFFRFIEADTGRIVIDGLDISKVALRTLRERLTIIPQDAYLFKGTVRFNLDPFSVRDDADLWDALHRVGLSNPSSNVSRTESYADLDVTKKDTADVDGVENERYIVKSLEMKVEEGGKNFSAGQRQLLALARGLLKLSTSSILILDESTASLDHATDERIQRTIREEMGDSTILTIAHRLKTIIDCELFVFL